MGKAIGGSLEKDSQKIRKLEYRICSSSGTYPEHSLITDDSALLVSQQLIISIWDMSKKNEEQILNAGLLLATDFKHGFLKLYGFPFTHTIEVTNSDNLLQLVEADIQQKSINKIVLEGDVLPEFDCYQNAKGASLPLLFNGLPYSKSKGLIDVDAFEKITKGLRKSFSKDLIEITDLLVISSKLSCHFQFQAEACLYLLEAVRKYRELSWVRTQPILKDWNEQLKIKDPFLLSKKVGPIEYIRIFRVMVNSIKNGYLNS